MLLFVIDVCSVCMFVCMYVCVYVCLCVCVYLCSGTEQRLAVVDWLRWLIDQAEHFEQ